MYEWNLFMSCAEMNYRIMKNIQKPQIWKEIEVISKTVMKNCIESFHVH